MLSTSRARSAALLAAAGVIIAGAFAVPAAHSAALPPTSQAATMAVENSAGLIADRAPTTEARRAATAHQAHVQLLAARAQAAAAAAHLRAEVVKIALSRKGMAYSAGSAGPTAFDCSGFTSWVWKTAGKTIERTSWDQFSTLRPVSRAQAKAGDLVFFFGDGAHHAALYLGHGKMIHAANYGSGVIISDVDGPWYGERISGFRSVL